VLGGNGSDSLLGEDGWDTVLGGGGDDMLIGDRGNDSIGGGSGYDVAVYAASINDFSVTNHGTYWTVEANDTLFGEFGRDTLFDVEEIRFNDDVIYPTYGDGNLVLGTSDDDSLLGTNDADRILGLQGNDTIVDDGNDDTIDGGNGDDQIRDSAGADSIVGGQGNDTIQDFDSEGHDTLSGGDGDDVIETNLSGGTPDRADGGAHHLGDTLVLTGAVDGPVVVDLSVAPGSDQLLSISGTPETALQNNFEHLDLSGIAGAGGIVTGSSDGNRVIGSNAADAVDGRDGNDTLIGGAGGDTLKGGNADDSIFGDGNSDLAQGNDSISGGAGSDTLAGDGGNDTISGGDNADRIDGGWHDTLGGYDMLSGDAGNDTLTYHDQLNHYDGGSGIDYLQLDSSVDFIELPDGNFNGIEVLDLRGAGGNDEVSLLAEDVLDIASGNSVGQSHAAGPIDLVIRGSDGDQVNLFGFNQEGGEFGFEDPAYGPSTSYNIYSDGAGTVVAVESGVVVNTIGT
jgi:Ca2+-binding RTX toxin-like protein